MHRYALLFGWTLALLGCGSSSQPTGGSSPSTDPAPMASNERPNTVIALPPSTRPVPSAVCKNEVNGSTAHLSYLSSRYENICGDCHGNFGEGLGKFPTLPGQQPDWESFRRAVREGRLERGMPAFSAELFSDSELKADWQKLSDSMPAARAGLAKSVAPEGPEVFAGSAQELQAAIDDGLKVWRSDGKRGACASCHGPLAADLARIAYRDSTILRRAIGQEIAPEDAQRIVKMVHAVRAKYEMVDFCDPSARIFQPGGSLLPGTSELERDIALNDELKQHGVDLETPIASAEQARAVLAALVALDLRSVRVALPLNRWTEDAFHGDLHNSLAEWIPEYPRQPKRGSEQAWYALHDAYIADPTIQHLFAIFDATPSLTTAEPVASDTMKSAGWMLEKYRAVLLGQYMLLHNVADYDVYPERGQKAEKSSVWIDRDALWSAGESARHLLRVGDLPAIMRGDFADFVQAKAGYDVNVLQADTMRFAVPWFYLGELFDPSMEFTNNGFVSFEYAGLNGMPDMRGADLALHGVFRLFYAVVNAEEAAPTTWRRLDRVNGRWASSIVPYWGAEWIRVKPIGERYSYNDPDPVQNRIWQAWMLNIQRIMLFRMLDDIGANHEVNRLIVDNRYIENFTDDQLSFSTPELLPAMKQLRNDLNAALQGATIRDEHDQPWR